MKPVKFAPLLILLSSGVMAQADINTAKSLVDKMTLEEKVHLVVGMGMKMPGTLATTTTPVVGQTMDKVAGAAGTTYAIPHLGIPNMVVADGPAGLRIEPKRAADPNRTFYATAFPVGTLLASTWDTTLVKKVGQAMGNEVKEYGVDVLLAPAMNIHRNPLGGRNFEYYSEDPIVAGNIAAAMINGIESNGVGTSLKHFAANNQETNRNQVNTILSERALREIYLKGFEIAIKKAQPWTVMSSYNKINGTYTSEEYDLLTTILRKEWGYKGMVMTDWFGGKDPVAQLKAGNDLMMPGTAAQSTAILNAVNNGTLDVKILNEDAERVVRCVLESSSYKKYHFSDAPDLKAHALIARAAASEGMILLKNDGHSLPLAKTVHKIATFGNISYDFISGGTGSGDVNEAYTISLVEGLKNAGYMVDPELRSIYEQYITVVKANQPPKQNWFELPPPLPEMINLPETLKKTATDDDVAFITIGRNAGEGQDRKKENDFNLRPLERELIRNVSEAFHAKGKKVIVILNTGGVVEVDSWRGEVDGILLAWQGGQEGGNAVADILSGKINPSGKLATSFPIAYDDVPSSKNFPGITLGDTVEQKNKTFFTSLPSQVTYTEGIYVGYRYYNSFHVKTAYPFGYGLSYTQFSYHNLHLSSPSFDGDLTATVTITNTGSVAGKEVVQLYIAAPQKSFDKPTEELKGFAKTALLAPGQSETVSFVIQPMDLASYDSNASAWVAENGKYTIKIGASSTEFLQTADFTLAKDRIVEKCNKVLTPQVAIDELKK